jgi:aspartyl-tRNA(Asn)/glutamyl-tRNA(Gln) amidotransferase subunit B
MFKHNTYQKYYFCGMNSVADKYDIVIGLEVHIQLTTSSKLFCSDAAHYGGAANEHTSAITLGHPGTLPRVNEAALYQAIKLGLALGCSITPKNYFSRKHYLYPDLPKGFQTTQHVNPICEGGTVNITYNNQNSTVQIHHIHLEEDAGKSIHDAYPDQTAIDYNRAGTPLCELVTEPCISSSEEAYYFLSELRKLVKWIGVSDGNMDEGSLRCDANISIKPKGTTKLGTRVEVKNLNSIKFVKKAIDIEATRLMQLVEEGQPVQQETRAFDAATETTFTLRTKEDANDYRYFIEPDLSPIIINTTTIATLEKALPKLPHTLEQEFVAQYGLSKYDAGLLVEELEIATYFTSVVAIHPNAKGVANFMNGPVKSYCKEQAITITAFPLVPAQIAAIVKLVDANTINFSIASGKLFMALLKEPDSTPEALVKKLGLIQNTDTGEIENWINTVIEKNQQKVTEYKKGKKGLIGFFMGEVVKLSKGKAEPKTTQELLKKLLD